MKPTWLFSLTACLLAAGAALGQKPQSSLNKIQPVVGPANVTLGAQTAKLSLPKNFLFLKAGDARKVMEAKGDKPEPGTLGMLVPRDGRWWAALRYDEVGFVKDDEADKMNADTLLKQYKEGTAEQNEESKRRGEPQMEVDGWYVPPHYDRAKHTVTWAIIGKEQGSTQQVINWKSVVLGRRGIMETTVVGDYADAAALGPQLAKVEGFVVFTRGQDYASFQRGDRMSELTMTGLVTGGAAAAAYGAAKLGLLGKFGKLIIVMFLAMKKAIILVVAGVAAGVKSLWARITGRRNEKVAMTDTTGSVGS